MIYDGWFKPFVLDNTINHFIIRLTVSNRLVKSSKQLQHIFYYYITLTLVQRNPDGFMQWPEFMELQRCLLAWHNMFKQYDADRSGYIESNELGNVVRAFGM